MGAVEKVAGFISGMLRYIDPFGFFVSIMFISAGLFTALKGGEYMQLYQQLATTIAGCGSMLYGLLHIRIFGDERGETSGEENS